MGTAIKRNSVMKFLCTLGIILQMIAVLSAADSEAASKAVNLLKNGDFESGIANWHYYGGAAPGEYEIIKPGHEGEQCLHLQSDKSGYHGGIRQRIALSGNRRYKLSAWIKADISPDGKVLLLYYDGGKIISAKYGKTKTKSFNWQYIEKIIETPEEVDRINVTVYPALFYGNTSVWIDNVQLKDLGTAKLGKETFSRSFDDPKAWKLTAHVNEKPAPLPEGIKLQADNEHKCNGKSGLKLNYVFPSAKHDAIMLTSDITVSSGSMVGLRVFGDGSGHELFLVLFDKSGEAHYLPVGPVNWKGWKTVSIANLLEGPPTRYDVSCNHWGGDKNQKLNLPITKITVGINDKPDKFQGKGTITLGWIKFYQ